jgi:uncharacterized damage-inducible protein DinB
MSGIAFGRPACPTAAALIKWGIERRPILEEVVMKEIFVAYSRYNRKANAAVFDAIAEMGAEELRHPIKAYYPTIVQTLGHAMRSDIKWLGRLSAFRASPVPKDAASPFSTDDAIDPEKAIAGLGGFVGLRSRVDEAIVAAISAIPEGAFAEDFEIEWGNGTMKRVLWQLLMQWFNHQTHHRGQASIQLDELGVANDFSGVLDKIG